MAAAAQQVIANQVQNLPKVDEAFVEKHFAKIAYAVSSLVLFIISPLALLLGAAAGYAINQHLEPNLKLDPNDPILTIPHTVLAIVGAAAGFVSLTPAGAMGSFAFKVIPFLASLATGSVVYRTVKSCN